MFQLGYNTNGFKSHPLLITIDILAKIGYQCIAITIDYFSINPYQLKLKDELDSVRDLLAQKKMSCVIETGSAFLLDPWRKHEPTLISREQSGRKKRLDFLKRAVDIANSLDAIALSFWAGKKPKNISTKQAWAWIEEGCRKLCDYAEVKDIQLAFEPEPGMLVENLSQFEELKKRVSSDRLGLTLDLGHAYLTETISPAECISKYISKIKNIHIEDMQRPLHNHLFFGEGDIDFPAIFQALEHTGYNGPVTVELSRHSHEAVITARKAWKFLLNLKGKYTYDINKI
jgi:sugar phosphate isomerase/epimerase